MNRWFQRVNQLIQQAKKQRTRFRLYDNLLVISSFLSIIEMSRGVIVTQNYISVISGILGVGVAFYLQNQLEKKELQLENKKVMKSGAYISDDTFQEKLSSFVENANIKDFVLKLFQINSSLDRVEKSKLLTKQMIMTKFFTLLKIEDWGLIVLNKNNDILGCAFDSSKDEKFIKQHLTKHALCYLLSTDKLTESNQLFTSVTQITQQIDTYSLLENKNIEAQDINVLERQILAINETVDTSKEYELKLAMNFLKGKFQQSELQV